jgi:hypothetical protein
MPLCPFNAESNGWCARHQDHAKGTPAVKPKKAPKKESDHIKAVKSELKKMYPVFLAQRPVCEIASPNCTKRSTCIHHIQGRGKNEVLNVGTWKASCEPCNLWCETNHTEAEAKGFKKRRHHKK